MLTWEGRRLTGMTMNGGQFGYEFKYNADGIRTMKSFLGGTAHVYGLNGSQIQTETIGNKLLVYLYDESGSPIGLQYRTTSYAANRFDTYYFEKNLQGDIIAVYTEGGTKIGSYTYDAWGVCSYSYASGATSAQKQIVSTLNPFRYRGYYYDTETGFYYLQTRYYNPQWGRFLNADGYVNANGGLIGFNMFAYCSSNPTMYFDSEGKECEEILEAWSASMWWLPVADGPIPIGEIVYFGGIAVLAIGTWLQIEGGDIHHILHGTDNKHEEGWKAFGIDPKKPDDDGWKILAPIIEEVIQQGEVIKDKITEAGDRLIYYAKEYVEQGKTVVVKVWEHLGDGIQKLSDAWTEWMR